MEKREQYKRLIMFTSSAVILLLQTAIFAFVWFHYYAYTGAMETEFFRRGNYVIIGLYAVMLYLFYKLYGGFKVGYLRVFDVFLSQVLSVLGVNAITYIQLCLIGHWRFLEHIGPMIQMTIFDLVAVVIWIVFARLIYAKIYPPRKMLLVYGEYSPDGLIRKMASREDKYNIEETISINKSIEEIKAKILEYKAIILADIPAEIRNKLLKYCFEKNIRCYSIPKISDIMIMSAEDIHLFDTALLLFRNRGLTVEQQFVKRAFDIVVSLLAIIISSPIMILIAILIKGYDGGPVFFKQKRLTKDGKIFEVYKFRSMRVQKEGEGMYMTRKDDDRITPVGKIIRNIHFDELPQIFNILKGEMSFVGPRPECPNIANDYTEIIPEFPFRLKVKAGLTGFAQVYGKYNTTPYDKLKLDLSYIENYSFMLDIKLMFLTFKILFQKENTEGIEAWQMTAATKENLENVLKKKALQDCEMDTKKKESEEK